MFDPDEEIDLDSLFGFESESAATQKDSCLTSRRQSTIGIEIKENSEYSKSNAEVAAAASLFDDDDNFDSLAAQLTQADPQSSPIAKLSRPVPLMPSSPGDCFTFSQVDCSTPVRKTANKPLQVAAKRTRTSGEFITDKTDAASAGRQRLFPGPAGLLPRLPPGNATIAYTETPAKERPVPQPDHLLASQQESSGGFLACGVWKRALAELNMSTTDPKALLNRYNVGWIRARASPGSSKKMPFFIAKVKNLDLSRLDPSCRLEDHTGVVGGSLHRNIMDTCGHMLQVGSVLVLKNPTVLVTLKMEYVNITLNNILSIYRPDTVSHMKRVTAKDMETAAVNLDKIRQEQMNVIQNSFLPSGSSTIVAADIGEQPPSAQLTSVLATPPRESPQVSRPVSAHHSHNFIGNHAVVRESGTVAAQRSVISNSAPTLCPATIRSSSSEAARALGAMTARSTTAATSDVTTQRNNTLSSSTSTSVRAPTVAKNCTTNSSLAQGLAALRTSALSNQAQPGSVSSSESSRSSASTIRSVQTGAGAGRHMMSVDDQLTCRRSPAQEHETGATDASSRITSLGRPVSSEVSDSFSNLPDPQDSRFDSFSSQGSVCSTADIFKVPEAPPQKRAKFTFQPRKSSASGGAGASSPQAGEEAKTPGESPILRRNENSSARHVGAVGLRAIGAAPGPPGAEGPSPSGGDGDRIGELQRTDSSISLSGSQYLIEAILSDLDDDMFFNF